MADKTADFRLNVEATMAIVKNVPFTLEVRTAPDFFLAVAPAALAVDKGAIASFTVTATAAGSFAKNIQLTLAGLPTGVTPTFSVNPIGPNGSSVISIPTVNIPVGPPIPLVLTGTEV